MFFRMIKGALFRQKSKMIMIAFTILLGTALCTSMLNTMLGVGDKVNQELKTYGANINVLPKEASLLDDIYGIKDESEDKSHYLKEDELGNIKTIFWAFNIVDYTPYFNTDAFLDNSKVRVVGTWFNNYMKLPTGEEVTTGIKNLKNWWEVTGEWLDDDSNDEIMLGHLFALKNNLNVGDSITLKNDNLEKTFTIKGIFNAGSEEDEYVFVPLSVAQSFEINKDNAVSRIEVSALTTPDNDLSRKASRNPKSLTVKEWEVWYCTAYVSAICYQIQEVITDSVAKPIRQVAESEGDILNKTTLLMVLITILSVIGSALSISNLVTSGVMERQSEIGLMKALGANNRSIITLILTEIIVTGFLGGILGYFLGLGLTQIIGYGVFSSSIPPTPMVIPIVALIIFVVTILGSIPAIRYLLHLNPTEVLHGR